MTRWLVRLAFPALGLLVALIIFGVKAPETATEESEQVRESTTMPSFEAIVPLPVVPEGPDIVFKWQDADGNWHYADQPPEEGPWNTLAIEPGQKSQAVGPDRSDTADDDLAAPYSAPFALDPRYPESGT